MPERATLAGWLEKLVMMLKITWGNLTDALMYPERELTPLTVPMIECECGRREREAVRHLPVFAWTIPCAEVPTKRFLSVPLSPATYEGIRKGHAHGEEAAYRKEGSIC
jgi:hypothetical protein